MMSRRFFRRIRKALWDDLIGYFVPLSNTAQELLARIGVSRVREQTFLRLEVRQLQAAYRNQGSWMQLPSGDGVQLVPLVAAADWSRDRSEAARVHVTMNDEQFELDATIRGLTEPALRAYLAFLKQRDRLEPRPDLNLRIANWHQTDDCVELTVQPVSYFDHIKTNLTMDYICKPGGYCLREKVHGDHCLEPLGKTTLADHLGIDVLLFSVDGNLILSRRSRRLAVMAGRLGPAGAGAIKTTDFPKYRRRVSLPELSLLRELFEETGLAESDVDLESLHILGIARDLIRGGKPQLFLTVRGLLTADTILEKWESAETYYEHKKLISIPFGKPALNEHLSKDELSELRGKVSDFVRRYSTQITEPLLGALSMWWREREQAVST